MSGEARERSFDVVARGLASGSISRSKALRLMGAALVGGTLASFPGGAWAAKGGRSSCAHFCQSLFGANTPEEAECVSQGTKGQGPCFTCTTETGCGPNFTKPPCPGQTYSCSRCTCCTSIAGTCSANDQCCSGRCAGGMCAEPCSSDRVLLSNGTCAKTCELDTECAEGCFCLASADPTIRTGYCGTEVVVNRQFCSTDAGCPPGQWCHHQAALTDVCANAC
jgi:hypothetical protein